jgi:hypothetical protein
VNRHDRPPLLQPHCPYSIISFSRSNDTETIDFHSYKAEHESRRFPPIVDVVGVGLDPGRVIGSRPGEGFSRWNAGFALEFLEIVCFELVEQFGFARLLQLLFVGGLRGRPRPFIELVEVVIELLEQLGFSPHLQLAFLGRDLRRGSGTASELVEVVIELVKPPGSAALLQLPFVGTG